MSNQNEQSLTPLLLGAYNSQVGNNLSQAEMLAAVTALATTMAYAGNDNPQTFILRLCQSLMNLNTEFIEAAKVAKEVLQ